MFDGSSEQEQPSFPVRGALGPGILIRNTVTTSSLPFCRHEPQDVSVPCSLLACFQRAVDAAKSIPALLQSICPLRAMFFSFDSVSVLVLSCCFVCGLLEVLARFSLPSCSTTSIHSYAIPASVCQNIPLNSWIWSFSFSVALGEPSLAERSG